MDERTTSRWVKNISKRQLSQTELCVLSRGLNYAITPSKIPYEEYILATELACQSIKDQGKKAELRNEIAGILKAAKLPSKNVNKEKRKATYALAKDKTITIIPADKGRTTVVMDTEHYEQQMENMLKDTDTYELLKKDPTEEKRKTLKTLLKPLINEGKIDKDTYNHLVPTASIIPRIYGTPKIHKKDTPLRPIVDSIGSITYNLSKALVELIKPLLGQTEQHCKNSKQLAQELEQMKVHTDEILISHDVISLFTKTPIHATLHIVENRLRTDKTLRKRTNLTVDDIIRLLHFVSTSTYFRYKGKIYRQKEGFAMGDPLSAIMSGFFMEDLEEKAINTAPTKCGLTMWRRYVDDILEKIKKGHTQDLTEHLNTIDNTGNIRFTHEEETNHTINFLDMNITHKEDGSIKIKIYRKPTHTDQYLLWTSEHPTAHKLSVIRTLYDRTKIITDIRDRQKEEEHIKKALKQCGYPNWAIKKGQRQVMEKKTKTNPRKDKEKKENIAMVTLPYIRGITEKVQRTMKKHNISTPVKPYRKLRQILVHPKDKIEPDQKCNVIYEIPCKSCNKTYIGETGRAFSTRKKEHRVECEKETARACTRATKQKAEQEQLKSAISDHCKRENHIMDWDGAKIIGTEDNKHRRWIKEAIEIRKRAPGTVNRDEGAFLLSHTWDAVLKKSDCSWRCRPTSTGRKTAPKPV